MFSITVGQAAKGFIISFCVNQLLHVSQFIQFQILPLHSHNSNFWFHFPAIQAFLIFTHPVLPVLVLYNPANTCTPKGVVKSEQFTSYFSKISLDLNCSECSFFIKVIVREGFEELRPRMWKNIQDKRRLLKMFTEQTVKWEGE